MSDRFRFRVWLSVMKIMDYGNIGNIEKGQIKLIAENCPLMQCTGLKDKNGKLIFEHDLIKFEEYVMGKDQESITVVEWMGDYGEWSPFGSSDESLLASHVEIIGNLYENPELLK